MKIELMWPECKFINKNWIIDGGIDSYWVECTIDEAEKNVFPYLSESKIQESLKNHATNKYPEKFAGMDQNNLFFLISKDLQSIEPFYWTYPFSGQWNGYCPFREIKKIEIKELKELANIDVVMM